MKIKIIFCAILSVFFIMLLTGCSSLDDSTKDARALDNLIKSGRLNEADIYCGKQEGESRKDCYTMLAEAYFTKKDYDSAVKCYLKADENIIFEEDFIDNSYNWSEGSDQDKSIEIRNGKYIFEHKREKSSWMSWSSSINIDESLGFKIQSTMTKVNGIDDYGYGIAWGLKDGDNRYEFCIDGNGYYFIGKDENDEWKDIVDWTESSFINKENSTNTLAVEKSGDKLKFYINGHFVNECPYEHFFGKKIGFILYRNMKIEFDNIIVTQFAQEKEIYDIVFQRILDDGDYYSFLNNCSKAGYTKNEAYVKIAEVNLIKGDYSAAAMNLERAGWAIKDLRKVKIFEDHFDDNTNAWFEVDDENTFKEIKNGKYIFYKKKETGSSFTWPQTSINIDVSGDFKIEGTMTKLEGLDNHGYGICWGLKDIDNCYMFYISGDGSYTISKYENAKWKKIVGWTKSVHINKFNSMNTLAVEKSGNRMKFYINGHLANELPYERFFSNKIAFIVCTKMKVEIDNIIVTQSPPKIALALAAAEKEGYREKEATVLKEDMTGKAGSKRWAVIIGISNYEDSRIPPLRFAAADAKAFYDWSVSTKGGKYPPSQVLLLTDQEATYKNMKNALFTWLKQPLEEDIVTIYFAGHGSPDSPDSTDNLFLLPYDTQYDDIASSGFPMWDIQTALKRFIKAKKVVIIADACHAGGVGQTFDIAMRSNRGISINAISTGLQNLSNVGDGVCVISASDDKQFSQENQKWGGGHGVFTYFLLKGLNGEADYDKDNHVSLGELIPYLSQQVRRATNSAQCPVVSGKFDPALSIAK